MNAQTQTVSDDLRSFFHEIVRFDEPIGTRYSVHNKRSRQSRHYYIIRHREGRWAVYMESIFDEIKIKTASGDVLITDRNNKMYLNGRPVEEVCIPERCFTGKDIRNLIAVAGLIWQLWEHGSIHSTDEAKKIAEKYLSELLGRPP